MTRNINLPDQSWSFQPSCPLGPSSGNLPSWSNANNGFGNQALAQQTVYPGNLPVQSAYPSAGLTGTFTNNTLQQGLQQPVHPLPVQIAYPSAGLIGAFTNNTSFQQGFQQAVPVHGPDVVGLAQPQGISMNFSQNFNTQNYNVQNFDTQNFDTQNYNAQNFDTQNFDMQNFNAQNYNAQNYNVQNFDTQDFNAQNFNLQNFMNTPLDPNSLPAFNIQQNANGNPGTSAFQNISSDCIPISQDVLQRSNSHDSEDTWHSFSSHSITPPLQSFSSDSISERPRPRRNNQGQVGAPGIRFCVRSRHFEWPAITPTLQVLQETCFRTNEHRLPKPPEKGDWFARRREEGSGGGGYLQKMLQG
ncbi:hypothetical protein FAVG1_06476 [Fusarium avenaceum]|nr:hypothetical protein FAVG1_06476 [Fusarium avenaceum]